MRGAESLLICVTGAECTGKTTLAEWLARYLDVPLVPEVAREYLTGRDGYTREDVLAIGRLQEAAEQAALRDAPVAVADTDVTVIQVWWEVKYGSPDPWIVDAMARRSERRYLVPRPDIPWEADPLRESPRDRERLHERYLRLLGAGPYPFAEISGRGPIRMEHAAERVAQWLRNAPCG
ncbi:MAG TPA: ATP-binding protein [Pseudomonadales bacterium]